MKIRMLSLLVLMGLSSFTLFASSPKTEKFKVAGNCGMCEARIEKAAKSVKGVESADWNKETKMIEVKYNPAETDIKKVHAAIAKVGHDTEIVTAPDDVYDNLPGCCKYERMKQDAQKGDSGSDAMHHGDHGQQ